MLSDNNKYSLYNKDVRILDFHCVRNSVGEPDFVVDKSYSDDSRLPFNFSNISYWIGNRRAPRNREHIDEILRKCGCMDLEGFARFTYCASLNDTFWVKPQESSLTWDKVSLYQNHFDETIAKIAFDGGLVAEKLSSPSPELITDGTVAKCWRRFGDDIYLLKRGMRLSRDEKIYGLGPQSEKYAYDLAKHLCRNPLEYDVISYHGKIASKCQCFCDEQTSYAPVCYILGEKARLSDCLDYFDSIGSGEEFREMVVLDSLTFNEDRHLKNFGVLYDADTMQVKGMAPVFDNNLALFPNHRTEEMNTDRFLENRTSHFGLPFDELARKCMTPSIKEKLISLRGFEFDKTGDYPLDDERVKIIEQIIDKQIDTVLDKKVYAVQKEDGRIVADSISLAFDKAKLPDEAFDILIHKDFMIPDFDVITESNEKLSVKDIKFDVVGMDNKVYLDIYESKLSGKSQSMVVKSFSGFSCISKDMTKEIILAPDEVNVQLSNGRDIVQSYPDVKVSLSNLKAKHAAINKVLAKADDIEARMGSERIRVDEPYV